MQSNWKFCNKLVKKNIIFLKISNRDLDKFTNFKSQPKLAVLKIANLYIFLSVLTFYDKRMAYINVKTLQNGQTEMT